MKRKICTILLLVVPLQVTNGYEVSTHEIMTEEAFAKSVIFEQDKQYLVGLTRYQAFDRVLSPQLGQEIGVVDVLKEGAVREDDGLRVTSHFYDPVYDTPLTNIASTMWGVFLNFHFPSLPHRAVDWATESGQEFTHQDYSYKDAKRYWKQSVAASTYVERRIYEGKLFRALGQVVHLIQDAAQPQHSRDDVHCNRIWTCYSTGVGYDLSFYEVITSERPKSELKALAAAGEVYHFNTLRSFWVDEGRGLSEFTNRNFISKNTNYGGNLADIRANSKYPEPSGSAAIVQGPIDIQTLPGAPPTMVGDIWFVSEPIDDVFTGISNAGAKISSWGLFGPDLKYYEFDKQFSINRWVYNDANSFLIPRATGYSAGILDYFFRGDLGIEETSAGAVAITDASGETDIGSFSSIKLAMQNTSNDIIDFSGAANAQEAPAGALTAYVRYNKNACYRADLSGEPVSGVPSDPACFDTNEYLSVSAPVPINGELDAGVPLDVEFDFSSSPIPLDAVDIMLQVVYEGELGEEDDAIMVVTKDLSEPTFISVLNVTDYFWLAGAFRSASEIMADEDLIALIDLDEDGLPDYDLSPAPVNGLTQVVNGVTETDSVTVPPGEFTRIAILTDSNGSEIQTRYSFGAGNTISRLATYEGKKYQLANEPPGLSAVRTVRGVPFYHVLMLYKGSPLESPPPLQAFYDMPSIAGTAAIVTPIL